MKDLLKCKNIKSVIKLKKPKTETLIKYWSSTAGTHQYMFYEDKDKAKEFVKTLLGAGITPDIYETVKREWDLKIK